MVDLLTARPAVSLTLLEALTLKKSLKAAALLFNSKSLVMFDNCIQLSCFAATDRNFLCLRSLHHVLDQAVLQPIKGMKIYKRHSKAILKKCLQVRF